MIILRAVVLSLLLSLGIIPSALAQEPMRSYAGSGFDNDPSLTHFRQRNYDTRAGLFLSPDPLFIRNPELCLRMAAECNLFGYSRSSPSSNRDPSGLITWKGFKKEFKKTWVGKQFRKAQAYFKPKHVYRGTSRTPDSVASIGMHPANAAAHTALEEYVQRNDHNSQYVSTSSDFSQSLVFAAKADSDARNLNPHAPPSGFVYKIATSRVGGENPVDVNAHFDRIGMANPYRSQKEWAYNRALPAQSVVGYIHSREFVQAPDGSFPDNLQPWKPLPPAAPPLRRGSSSQSVVTFHFNY
jgi:RHS repeat-associated protein